MVAAYRSRTERDRRADDFLDLERIDRERYTDDIDDGIDRTHLVEMHRLDRNIMYFRFGYGNFLENSQAQLHNSLVKAGLVNDLDNLRIVTVVFRRPVRVEQYIHLQGRDAAFVHAFPFERERLDMDFSKLLIDVVAVGPGVD